MDQDYEAGGAVGAAGPGRLSAMSWRNISAVVLGAIVGVALASVYFAASSPGNFLGDIFQKMRMAAFFAGGYAALTAVIASLGWWVLGKIGRNGLLAAGSLGFAATVGTYFAVNYDGAEDLAGMMSVVFPYALCGSVAGMVSWYAGDHGDRA